MKTESGDRWERKETWKQKADSEGRERKTWKQKAEIEGRERKHENRKQG